MATLNHVLDSYGILEDKDPWDVFKQATSARMAPPARNASMRSEKPPETRQWAPSTGRSARSRSDPSGTLVGP